MKQDQVSTGEASRILGVSSEHVRRLCTDGTLPATVTPLGRLIPRAAVEALARKRAAK